jgi:ABC-type glycerol-3-phosphate transport system substrate-binding protein
MRSITRARRLLAAAALSALVLTACGGGDSDPAAAACVTWPNHGWFFEQTIAQQGETYVDNDNGRSAIPSAVRIDQPAMVDYLTFWSRMEDKGHYVYTGTQRDWDGTYNLFAAQQVPFLIYSSSDTTGLTDEGKNGGFDVVASFMPRNADRTDGGGNIIGGASLWLVDGLDSGTEDAALAFLNYLNNPENAADWHKVTGYIPITEAAVDLLEAEGWFEANPNSRVANDQLSAAPATPATAGALVGNLPGIRDVVTQAAEDIIVNDRDPATRLGEAQAAAQQLLDDFNAVYGGGPSGESSISEAGSDAASGEVVDVKVWIAFTDYRLDWTQAIAEEFNGQLDGYRIVVEGYASYEELLPASLLAFDQGTPPEIIQYSEATTIDAINLVSASGESVFANITQRIGGRREILGVPVVIDDVVAAARNYYTIDGELRSMPWNTSSAIMFTNVTLLESRGVTGIPATWQELEAACEAYAG